MSDIAIDPRNPFVFYVGLGHGGVFKTNDNGVTFPHLAAAFLNAAIIIALPREQ